MSPKGKPGVDPRTFQKILLIRLRRIGDIILTTPAARALKAALPQAELVYIVEEPYRKLVEGNPDLARIIVIRKGQSRREFLKLVRNLRRERFDAVLDFHGGPTASLLTWLSGAKLKIGYGVKYRKFIYDVRIPRRPGLGRIHSVENHINLVRALGVDVLEIPSLILPEAAPEEKERIRKLLTEIGKDSGAATTPGIVLLHIGSGNKFRSWGADNLIKLIKLLEEIPDVRTVLIGGQEDTQEEKNILAEVPGTFSLVGRLNLIEMREIMAQTALFAGPDSGPMHMAAAAGLPIVAWFGPNLPAYFSPWKPAGVSILEKPLACRPCKQRDCVHGDYRCIKDITPDEVFEACLEHLSLASHASKSLRP